MISRALTAIATWVGRSGREKDQARAAEWAAILLPFDVQEWALRYLKAVGARIPTSTCALVGLRFWAVAGCTCSEHQKRYESRMGRAVADIEDVARRHGAWVTDAQGLSTYPAPGDVLCMRRENPHVSVVVGSRAADGAILSIDGGQEDNTWTRYRARRLQADGTVVDLDDGVATNVGRISKLYARVDSAKIAASLEKCR